MKIRDIIVEAPMDSTGTAVGQGLGRASYGLGNAAGRLAGKLGNDDPKKANVKNEPHKARILRSIGRGIKSGLRKYATGDSQLGNYNQNDLGAIAGRVAAGKSVTTDQIEDLIKALPSLKVSWRVDINGARQALEKAHKGETLLGTDQNALEILAKDLKKV